MEHNTRASNLIFSNLDLVKDTHTLWARSGVSLEFLAEKLPLDIECAMQICPCGFVQGHLKHWGRDNINNIPTLVQVMAWRRPGDKPLSEPMMVRLPTHICVTRLQWVKRIIVVTYSGILVVKRPISRGLILSSPWMFYGTIYAYTILRAVQLLRLEAYWSTRKQTKIYFR